MNRLTGLAATLATISTSAFAGGIDRSGQDISIIFEEGSYAHLSFGAVIPSLSGIAGGVVNSDNMAPRYGQFAGAFKYQLNDKTSLSFIVDQPIGANVEYPLGTGYPLAGTTATIKSTAYADRAASIFGTDFGPCRSAPPVGDWRSRDHRRIFAECRG